MKLVKRKSTCGALNRRFARDMDFQHSQIVAGPGATHAGLNGEMALRFGIYAPKRRPLSVPFLGYELAIGRYASLWAELSDMESNWLVLLPFVAIGWK